MVPIRLVLKIISLFSVLCLAHPMNADAQWKRVEGLDSVHAAMLDTSQINTDRCEFRLRYVRVGEDYGDVGTTLFRPDTVFTHHQGCDSAGHVCVGSGTSIEMRFGLNSTELLSQAFSAVNPDALCTQPAAIFNDLFSNDFPYPPLMGDPSRVLMLRINSKDPRYPDQLAAQLVVDQSDYITPLKILAKIRGIDALTESRLARCEYLYAGGEEIGKFTLEARCDR